MIIEFIAILYLFRTVSVTRSEQISLISKTKDDRNDFTKIFLKAQIEKDNSDTKNTERSTGENNSELSLLLESLEKNYNKNASGIHYSRKKRGICNYGGFLGCYLKCRLAGYRRGKCKTKQAVVTGEEFARRKKRKRTENDDDKIEDIKIWKCKKNYAINIFDLLSPKPKKGKVAEDDLYSVSAEEELIITTNKPKVRL